MCSPSFNRRSGFTLTELLVSIGILLCLLALALPIFKVVSAHKTLTGCLFNERQLGIALANYVTENKGEWPYPSDNRKDTDPLGTWISRPLKEDGQLTGMGKLFPYARDKRLFVCPADKGRMKRVFANGNLNSEEGDFVTSYVTRGFNQSATPSRPNLKNTATMGRRAIYSCQFAYVPSNPSSYPLSWHQGKYPVLFSDGSVQVLQFPEGAVNTQDPPDINNSTARQIKIWDYFDGLRPTLSL